MRSAALIQVERELRAGPKRWLVTGAAGFLGSHLVEALLGLDQVVVGFDNLSTGKESNLVEVEAAVQAAQWERFTLVEADLRHAETLRAAAHRIDCVLHLAGMPSTVRAANDPVSAHASNVTGFLNVLVAARDQKVRRLVYASSAVLEGEPLDLTGTGGLVLPSQVLSPYAATALLEEVYAQVFAHTYELSSIGLRLSNIFGPRQEFEGPYAAVIPRWIHSMVNNEPSCIHGDGSTSRDFCYVANAVQAFLLAATTANEAAINRVIPIGSGQRSTLNQLFDNVRRRLLADHSHLRLPRLFYAEARPGQPRELTLDITKAQRLLQYSPTHNLARGIEETLSHGRKSRLVLPTVASAQRPVTELVFS